MEEIKEELKRYINENHKILTEFESKEILEKIGIPIPKQKLISNKNDLHLTAENIGYPIVLKLMAEDIVHKSDTGAVKLNLKSKQEVEQAFDGLMKIPAQTEKKISVQKMADEPITELIIGVGTDAQFGYYLMFGIGGILVELFEDVSFRIIPADEYDFNEMIHEIKGFPLLDGFRGKPKADVEAIVNVMKKIANFIDGQNEIKEIDLNPVFIYEKGILCVDARIILKNSE